MFSSLLPVILMTALVASTSSLQASCEMRLHNNGTKIGKVTFTSRGNNQRIEVILKGDPEKITQGYHTLTVRSRAVQGKPANCDNTGDIFKKGGKVLGDFGGVRAGERGEVNQYHIITVDPDAMEEIWGVAEGVIHCPPVAYKIWPDGREEKIKDLDQAEIDMYRLLTEGKESFFIGYKEPDCYLPVSNKDVHTLNEPMFYLRGKKSIVGKAVVLQAENVESGESGEMIACCTLRRDN